MSAARCATRCSGCRSRISTWPRCSARSEVIARLDAAGIRSVPTGIEHGTVTAVLPAARSRSPRCATTSRTDGRHATVAFADDWREDAARRDFTINALYADPRRGELFDYFGGLDDLAARRVRFIGDARERIREDHLRILRYFRFQARFGVDARRRRRKPPAPSWRRCSRACRASGSAGSCKPAGPARPGADGRADGRAGRAGVVLPEAARRAGSRRSPRWSPRTRRRRCRPRRSAASPRCCPPSRPRPSRSPRGCACRPRRRSAWPARGAAQRRAGRSARARLSPGPRGSDRPAAAGRRDPAPLNGWDIPATAAQGRRDRRARRRRRARGGAHPARGGGALDRRRLSRRANASRRCSTKSWRAESLPERPLHPRFSRIGQIWACQSGTRAGTVAVRSGGRPAGTGLAR